MSASLWTHLRYALGVRTKQVFPGVRAVDITSPPTATANDPVELVSNKDNGGLCVQVVGTTGTIGVTEYTEGDAIPATPTGHAPVLRDDDGNWRVPHVNNAGAVMVQQADLDASIDDVTIVPTKGTLTDRSGTVTAGGASQTLAAAMAARQFLRIQNVDDSATIWINYTSDAAASNGSYRLEPGQSLEDKGTFCSTEKITVFSTVTGAKFTAKEA